MNKKFKIAIVVGLLVVLTAAIAISVNAVSGAAFTTYNPWVDGEFKDVCKNSIINCNIYGAKPDVWLNGGPAANGLGPDGEYFFAVLVPGGQPNPNDGGFKNLSDDFDAYTNRIFIVTDGEVSAYGGTHDLDSGNFLDPDRVFCKFKRGCDPDGNPPLIRLFPYADTWNPGGVYILAICSLEDGYPVDPRDCKYDAFKVKEGQMTYEFLIEGMKFHDLYADGSNNGDDYGLENWEITIIGTGLEGEEINETVMTGPDGFWSFGKSYSFGKSDTPVAAELEVCEVLQEGWYQSVPLDPNCYHFTLEPSAMAYRGGLDFGNYQPVEVTACKERQNYDSSTTPIAGWMVSLTIEDVVIDTQPTGENGCYTWTDLTPGELYDVHEEEKPGWLALGPVNWYFEKAVSGQAYSHTFVNQPLEGCTPGFWQGGNDFGTAGGKWYWNEDNDPDPDPDWAGMYAQPFYWGTEFCSVFGCIETGDMWYYINPDQWTTNDDFHKAARSITAAFLNASWGIGYPYTTSELLGLWTDAYNGGTLLALHTELDAANNAYYRPEPPAHCPISASIP